MDLEMVFNVEGGESVPSPSSFLSPCALWSAAPSLSPGFPDGVNSWSSRQGLNVLSCTPRYTNRAVILP